jgi:serine/threonine protein kinase
VPRRSYSAVDSTLQASTCGPLVVYSPRCAQKSHSSQAIPRLTKYLRSSSMVTLSYPCSKLTRPRVLGTPAEDEWPGVTTFPDYKSSFPKWQRDFAQPLCTSLDEHGLDLLDGLLVYDPASRVSAKQACCHAYFKGMQLAPNGFPYVNSTNGFH